jgi:hypothetical protein
MFFAPLRTGGGPKELAFEALAGLRHNTSWQAGRVRKQVAWITPAACICCRPVVSISTPCFLYHLDKGRGLLMQFLIL